MDSLPPEKLNDFKETFALFDKDGDGSITTKELGNVMRSLGQTPTESELNELIAEVDTDKNGSINFEEFVALMMKKMQHEDKEEDIREAFKVFDKQNTGYVNAAELKHILTHVGDALSEDDVDEFLRDMNIGQDGRIKFDEIVQTILRN